MKPTLSERDYILFGDLSLGDPSLNAKEILTVPQQLNPEAHDDLLSLKNTQHVMNYIRIKPPYSVSSLIR